MGRAMHEQIVVQTPDVLTEPDMTEEVLAFAREVGFRSQLIVPLLYEGAVIGVLALARPDAGPFADQQITLLQTFAAQAVIAIENVRLFKELEARTPGADALGGRSFRALGDVGRALSSTLDLDTVLQTIVTRASQLAGTDACSVFEYDETTEAFHLARATHNLDEEVVDPIARRTPTPKGKESRAAWPVTRQPVQIPDIAADGMPIGGPFATASSTGLPGRCWPSRYSTKAS